MNKTGAGRSWRALMTYAGALGCLTAGWLGLAASADAAAPGPDWVLTAQSGPSHFAPGSTGDQYYIGLFNQGGNSPDGSTITISDTLPAGVTATAIGIPDMNGNDGSDCDLATLTCTATSVAPGDYVMIVLTVSVPSTASGTLTDVAQVSGGGGAAVSTVARTVVSTTPASFGVSYVQTRAQDTSGNTFSQAGGHPFAFTTAIGLTAAAVTQSEGTVGPGENGQAKDIDVALPPGLLGNPRAIPQCPAEVWLDGQSAYSCPPDTQVGFIWVFFYNGSGSAGLGSSPQPAAVYNIVPPPGQPAEFGFTVAGVNVPIFFKVRTGSDYGLTAQLTNIPEGDPVWTSVLTLWGDPEDPSHDPVRAVQNNGGALGATTTAPDVPLLDYPSDCASGELTASATLDSWQNPGVPTATASSPLATPSSCSSLSFQSSLAVSEDSSQAGEPAGLQVTIHVPQSTDPSALQTPELQDAAVTLPQGVVVNPASAGGLQGCSDGEIALTADQPATCPAASQIGTVQVATPLLPDPLMGQVFLGTPQCSPCTSTDAQDGRMVRLFIQAQADGVLVKLAGSVSVNPQTGQLTATFDQNPQLPFSDLMLTLKGGPRAPIANPNTCGTYTTTWVLSAWSAPFTPDSLGSSSFPVTGCGNPDTFAPTFEAGIVNAQAGTYSPFTLTFSRSDSDQFFSGLSATLPGGVSAKLAGVPLCSNSDANAGTCPADSQVGSATIASGPGSDPLWIPQQGNPRPSVYLTGPYKGAPYGLVVEAPAIAGPFNLGTVVVRQALFVNPTTAQVTVDSDPFPTIIDGIPLQIRTISVTMDRPNFTLNPTSCDPGSITGTLTSTGGMSSNVLSRFQVGGCSSLGFSPKLKLSLSGKGKTRSGDHPTLTATLSQQSGQANIHTARVALPLSLALDPNNSQHVCNYQVAQAVHGGPVGCPASTIVGKATAVTPLLSQPLTGPVYLVQGIRFNSQGQAIHTLPSLLIPLRGQIALDLHAQSSVSGGKLVTTFSTIPDAPVSKFTLQITGGKKGLLVITGRGKSICGKPQVSNATLEAQSGKSMISQVKMATPCRKASRAKGHPKKRKK